MSDEATYQREEDVIDGTIHVYMGINWPLLMWDGEELPNIGLYEPGNHRASRYVRPGSFFEWRLNRARRIVDGAVARRHRQHASAASLLGKGRN